MRRKQLCRGIACCGKCGKTLDSGKDFYFCRSGCVEPIRVEDLDQKAMDYLRALAQGDVQERITNAMQDVERQGLEQEVVRARQRVEKVMDDLRVFLSDTRIKIMPDELQAWMSRPLPDREEMACQAEEAVRARRRVHTEVSDYFGMPIPESLTEQFSEARSAALWYISRIVVHEHSFDFESTFDKWLSMRM